MSDVTDIGTFDFMPLAHAHLPLVRGWLAQPHVARWYDGVDKALDSVRDHIEETGIAGFLVRLDARPIGYIQAYDPHAYPDHPYRDQPAGTRGIDQFIGEPDLVGRGHGPRFMREFVAGLFRRGAPRVVTDPDPANARAIRAYMKAGFRPLGPRDTPWGPVLLMAQDNSH